MTTSAEGAPQRGSMLHGGLSLSSGSLIAVSFFLPAVEACSTQSMAELSVDGFLVFFTFPLAALAAWAAAGAALAWARAQGAALLGQAATASLAMGVILPLLAQTVDEAASLSDLLDGFRYGFWLLMLGTTAALVQGARGSATLSAGRRRGSVLLACGLAGLVGAGLLLLNVILMEG